MLHHHHLSLSPSVSALRKKFRLYLSDRDPKPDKDVLMSLQYLALNLYLDCCLQTWHSPLPPLRLPSCWPTEISLFLSSAMPYAAVSLVYAPNPSTLLRVGSYHAMDNISVLPPRSSLFCFSLKSPWWLPFSPPQKQMVLQDRPNASLICHVLLLQHAVQIGSFVEPHI